jgi:pyruvate,water dikinase
MKWVRWFGEISRSDVPSVGGKNASLGELAAMLPFDSIVRVPEGFATTVEAYRHFLDNNGLRERITAELEAMKRGESTREETGRTIRRLITEAWLPSEITDEIQEEYDHLRAQVGDESAGVAVRSSATAEDLPEASFAGQHESFLNVRGKAELIDAVRRCFASAFTDRAIAYREEMKFDHMKVALSVGIQRMVRSDRGAAGVIFTLDPDTGFPNVVVINGSWGLGETVVQGLVNPDQFVVFKPFLADAKLRPIIQRTLGTKSLKLVYGRLGHSTRSVSTAHFDRERFVLSDDEVLTLARTAADIERHYGVPMDIEWAKDGVTNDLWVVQARSETVQSRKRRDVVISYRLNGTGRKLTTGTAVGQSIASGKVVRVLHPSDLDAVDDGVILVAAATEPDWTPVLRRVAGIITDSGGRTCHAAIVAREFGIPAIVGTDAATHILQNGQQVTISCAEGETGVVYDGALPFERIETPLQQLPSTKTHVMINAAMPSAAMRSWNLPTDGIGLARIEFIIADTIKVHPMALVRPEAVTSADDRQTIDRLTAGYSPRTDYFVEHLALGIAQLAASQYPLPVIVRTSDFKTNEYAKLIGGRDFEPAEENPMIGFRGASRYYNPAYAPAFALECEAIRRVRDVLGFTNVIVMIPFCRTLGEADRVLAEMDRNGLTRGNNGLEVYVMAEIPANFVLARDFGKRFDGFSIGSNDLTQLVLGIDRDSAMLSGLFDERNPAVTLMIRRLISDAHAVGRKVGICGQAPSDYPDFLRFLIEAGIDSISLNPDAFLRAKRSVVDAESGLVKARVPVPNKDALVTQKALSVQVNREYEPD